MPFPSNYKEIGGRLRAAREAASISQEDVAKQLDVTGPTYSKYEAGTHKIPIPELLKAAEFIGVNVDYLLTGKERNNLPEFHSYVRGKFRDDPRMRETLIQVYEAIQSVKEERAEKRRKREQGES